MGTAAEGWYGFRYLKLVMFLALSDSLCDGKSALCGAEGVLCDVGGTYEAEGAKSGDVGSKLCDDDGVSGDVGVMCGTLIFL